MFIKNKENFKCEKCETEVLGAGFTNHCPKCLWSKHVDNEPGDRASLCGGAMKPVELRMAADKAKILHQCLKCGHKKWNKANAADNSEEIIKISTLPETCK